MIRVMDPEDATVFRESQGQVGFEWEIRNFTKLKDSKVKYLHSPAFWLSNAEWYIKAYPYGDTEDSKGWISVYLMKKKKLGPKHDILVYFSIGLKKTDGSLHKINLANNFLRNDTCGYGWPKLFEVSKLTDSFLNKGNLTITLSARIPGSCFEQGIDNLCKDMERLHRDPGSCDLEIKVGDREFQAHRLILGARSSVFASMFEHEMAENTSGVVNITDCDPETVEDFLRFVYTGKTNHVTLNNAVALYRIADKYDVKDLMEVCNQCMQSEQSAESICDVFALATLHDLNFVERNAIEYFIENSVKVFATKEWTGFFKKDPFLANKLLVKMAEEHKKGA